MSAGQRKHYGSYHKQSHDGETYAVEISRSHDGAAYQAALKKAGDDPRRVQVEADGSVIVLNRPVKRDTSPFRG
jgi:hypothetical protein